MSVFSYSQVIDCDGSLPLVHPDGMKLATLDFLVNCLKSKEFIDGDTTTDFIDRVNPDRKLVIPDGSIHHVVAIAALWIQELNRKKSNVASFMPSGWTNGRLPSQSITFEYENNDIKVEYQLQRDGSFKFSNGKTALIYDKDEDGIDCVFDTERHYAKVTMNTSNILVHMPYGDVMLSIKLYGQHYISIRHMLSLIHI